MNTPEEEIMFMYKVIIFSDLYFIPCLLFSQRKRWKMNNFHIIKIMNTNSSLENWKEVLSLQRTNENERKTEVVLDRILYNIVEYFMLENSSILNKTFSYKEIHYLLGISSKWLVYFIHEILEMEQNFW
jgi:hypothetical protein